VQAGSGCEISGLGIAFGKKRLPLTLCFGEHVIDEVSDWHF